MITRSMRLARVEDFALADEAPWSINPRTKFLESRAPLTWTGVRPYKPNGPTGETIRVLHRPEQWEAPEPLRRLRCLTATQGHPKGDVNVSVENEVELRVGYTGDEIRIEPIKGYRCPTARVVATRPATIKRIQDGATQTSLGYTALWVGPPDDEMTTDPITGKPCGVWQGPNGPEYYDLEHIVDPDCELVQAVVKSGKAKFDPDQLGANHFAIALDSGRGGVQSELMRVVDSIDLDTVDVRDAEPKWVVGASEELHANPDASIAWDGDAAAASVFEWADFNSEEPDLAKARQAFLTYDSASPELKGSYKLPIARYADGQLEVLKSGLDAAAGYLPQTDVPQDVRDRARLVLDSYYKKFAAAQPARARDDSASAPASNPRITVMTTPTTTVHPLAVSRDLAAFAAKHQLAVPAPFKLVIRDEGIDAEKLMTYVQGMEELCAGMREMMGGMETQMEDASVDKAALEEKVKLAEEALKVAQAELGTASDAMKKACDSLVSERDVLVKERDALLTEVSPLRTAELDRVRAIAIKAGVAKDEADKLATIPELRRATVVARYPGEAAAFRDASDDAIALTYRVVSIGFTGPSGVVADPKTPTAPMPSPQLGKAQDHADPSTPPAPTPRTDDRPSVASMLSTLGGKPAAG